MGEPSIAAQVVALTHLSVAELRVRWKELTGEDTAQRNKAYLVRRCAWELQRQYFGDELSAEAKARLNELQDEFRTSPPETWFKGARHNRPAIKASPVRCKPVRDATHPKVGTIITRQYRGAKIVVTVVDDGYQYDEQVFRSLSAVATAVSGAHCSGPAFFGLNKKGGAS